MNYKYLLGFLAYSLIMKNSVHDYNLGDRNPKRTTYRAEYCVFKYSFIEYK